MTKARRELQPAGVRASHPERLALLQRCEQQRVRPEFLLAIVPSLAIAIPTQDGPVMAEGGGRGELKRMKRLVGQDLFDLGWTPRFADGAPKLMLKAIEPAVEEAVDEVDGLAVQQGNGERHEHSEREPSPSRKAEMLLDALHFADARGAPPA